MIHVVVGTKAQLIKMAPVMWAVRDLGMSHRLILTGQHAETMNEMLDDFGLRRPDVVLQESTDVVSVPQMLAWSARLLRWAGRDEAFAGDRRGVVLVHGDALSALVGALMGRRAGLTVGHVESGLRSFRPFDPFPEELTRLAVFRLSQILFCPGKWAADNVSRYRGKTVVDTGANTLRDVLEAARTWRVRIDVPASPFAVCTIHRYENIFNRERFARLIDLIRLAADRVPLLFVLHPPTARNLDRFGLRERLAQHPNISLRPRYPYFDFAGLLLRARFVMTDGGSNQEEAHYLGLPCLILRTATERPEGLGTNAVLSNLERSTVESFLDEPERYRRPMQEPDVSPSHEIAKWLEPYAEGSVPVTPAARSVNS
jgi:UDP-N-acetylglucosamine 2-epimerase (non-hydrolysing)